MCLVSVKQRCLGYNAFLRNRLVAWTFLSTICMEIVILVIDIVYNITLAGADIIGKSLVSTPFGVISKKFEI
jgi:hypothetical protein